MCTVALIYPKMQFMDGQICTAHALGVAVALQLSTDEQQNQ